MTSLAAVAGLAALYYSYRRTGGRGQANGEQPEFSPYVDKPPSTFGEAVLYLRALYRCGCLSVLHAHRLHSRGLPCALSACPCTFATPAITRVGVLAMRHRRYVWSEEALGSWGMGDLLIGLAYLSQRPAGQEALADIAAAGSMLPLAVEPPREGHQEAGALAAVAAAAGAAQALQRELLAVRRYLCYSRSMKLKAAASQAKLLQEQLGVAAEDILLQQPRAGLLRPAHIIVRDSQLRAIVLVIRGTQSLKDLFTTLTGCSLPHHAILATDHHGSALSNGQSAEPRVVLGYAHAGMLAAARWLLREVAPVLQAAMEREQEAGSGYGLCVTGHSMGAGVAVLLTMMLHEQAHAAAHPLLAAAHCCALACPSVLTTELAAACRPFVTSVIHGTGTDG